MIRHILKYKLPFPEKRGKIIELEVPSVFAICDINYQGDDIFIWAAVDINAPVEICKFVLSGTGWEIDNAENLYFLKTVHMPKGLVWHVHSVEDEINE